MQIRGETFGQKKKKPWNQPDAESEIFKYSPASVGEILKRRGGLSSSSHTWHGDQGKNFNQIKAFCCFSI